MLILFLDFDFKIYNWKNKAVRKNFSFRSEADYKVVEMDSHPAKTNGFLTGCLVETVLNQGNVPIEYFARFDLHSVP